MEIRNKHGEVIDHAFHDTDRDDVLVIVAHGLTGDKDRDLMVQIADNLAADGWPTMRISFSGCGESGGRFEDMNITKEVDDLHAVLDQVKGTKKIAYVGYSQGGAVGTLAAAKDDRINVLVSLAGMVNTKTFCETEFGEQIPGESCMWEDETHPYTQTFKDDLYGIGNTLTAARDIRSPWLMIHGEKDDVVLAKDSKDLFLTLRGKKKHVVIDDTDHSFEHYERFLSDEISTWLKLHVK